MSQVETVNLLTEPNLNNNNSLYLAGISYLMYIPDLTEIEWWHEASFAYDQSLPERFPAVLVGWLGNTVPNSGPVSPLFLDKLQWASQNLIIDQGALGEHECEICGSHTDRGEILIRHGSSMYVMPRMLLHYITVHSYQPPEQFVEAVEKLHQQHKDLEICQEYSQGPEIQIPPPWAPEQGQRQECRVVVHKGEDQSNAEAAQALRKLSTDFSVLPMKVALERVSREHAFDLGFHPEAKAKQLAKKAESLGMIALVASHYDQPSESKEDRGILDPFGAPVSIGELGETPIIIPFFWILIAVVALIALMIWFFW